MSQALDAPHRAARLARGAWQGLPLARQGLALAWRAGPMEWLVLLLLSAALGALMLTPSVYMLQVYDRVLQSRNELTLLTVSLVAAFLLGLAAVLDASRRRLLSHWVARLDAGLGPRLLSACTAAALAPPAGAGRAPQHGQPLDDWASVRKFLGGPGLTAFLDAPWTPVYMGVLFVLHPLLGALSLLFVALQALLAWQGHQRLLAPQRAALAAQAHASQFVQAKLRNAELISALGMGAALFERWQARHDQSLAAQDRAQRLAQRVGVLSKWLRYSQQSLGLGLGALLVMHGQMTAGAMIAANFLLARALAPIDQLVSAWPGLIEAAAAGRRLRRALHNAACPPAPAPGPRLPCDLQLLDVAMRVPGRSAPLLSGLRLQARPGTLTLIGGPSGAGKSTLARLLVGTWPCAAGQVLLNGQALSQAVQEGLHLGYLPQEPRLMEGSIAQNIARLGQADPSQVIAAARAAGLHEWILAQPQGYDTPVGEGGRQLSGGLRQRVALARALYGEPSLVVLDEPNAQLDEAGDAALLQALEHLKARGATVLVVSHRPSLRAQADQLLWLESGTTVCQARASLQPRPSPTPA